MNTAGVNAAGVNARRVVVLGAGLAGLVAATRLAEADVPTTLLTKGIGGLQLGQGTVDVLGYHPRDVRGARIDNPIEAVSDLKPDCDHPYRVIGADTVRTGISYLKQLLPDLLVGDAERNFWLPTAVGAIRPTCLAQPSMVAGDLSHGQWTADGASVAVVGLRQLKDFQAQLIAENLNRAELGGAGSVSARHLYLDFEAREKEIDSTGLVYARRFDEPDYRAAFARALAADLRPGEIVALPAILGYRDPQAWRDVQDRLGHPVFEIALPPPSVPGMRLNEALTAAAKSAGVRIVNGTRTVSFRREADAIAAVSIATVPRDREFRADAFLLANGGFESGALTLTSHGSVVETLFNLPLAGADDGPLLKGEYWGADQPLFRVGVRVDEDMAVADADGKRVYSNLWAAGGVLAGSPGWADKSGDGIALGSAVAAADAIIKSL